MDVKELRESVKKLKNEKKELKEEVALKISKIKKELNVKLKKIDKKISVLSTKIVDQEDNENITEVKEINEIIENNTTNEENQEVRVQNQETSQLLGKKDVEKCDPYEIKCFIAQYSLGMIIDTDIVKHLRKLKDQEILNLLNRTTKEENYLTSKDIKTIIKEVKSGMADNMLIYDLTDFISKLKNIIKGND